MLPCKLLFIESVFDLKSAHVILIIKSIYFYIIPVYGFNDHCLLSIMEMQYNAFYDYKEFK